MAATMFANVRLFHPENVDTCRCIAVGLSVEHGRPGRVDTSNVAVVG